MSRPTHGRRTHPVWRPPAPHSRPSRSPELSPAQAARTSGRAPQSLYGRSPTRRAPMSRTGPGRSRPPARADDMPVLVSAAWSQAVHRCRSATGAERRAPAEAGRDECHGREGDHHRGQGLGSDAVDEDGPADRRRARLIAAGRAELPRRAPSRGTAMPHGSSASSGRARPRALRAVAAATPARAGVVASRSGLRRVDGC